VFPRIIRPAGGKSAAATEAGIIAKLYARASPYLPAAKKILAVINAARAGSNLDQTLTGDPSDALRIASELSRAGGGGAGRFHVSSSSSSTTTGPTRGVAGAGSRGGVVPVAERATVN
jgi:hypothetical protein